MQIYVVYKKSDRSITDFVFDDGSNHVFTTDDEYALSTNTISWTENKTVNGKTLIKTFEDVKDSVASKLSVNDKGKLTKL